MLSSVDADPFSGTKGGPPKTGQCFIAIDYSALAGQSFISSVDQLVQAIKKQENTHVAGQKRKNNRKRIAQKGVLVNEELMQKINSINP
ncbi:MAG: hypothetical protein AAF403_05395 [Pseudomonadota bacterium]